MTRAFLRFVDISPLLAALALAAVLCGCSTTPRAERVEVPIQVPCRVTVPEEPVYATSTLTAQSTIWDQAKALLAEIQQRRAYTAKLHAAARACQ